MDKSKLIGAWQLLSSTQSRNDVVSKTYGDPPSGQIQYTDDGRMSAFLMHPDWALSGKNATEEFDKFFAYAGRWEINGSRVSHFIEYCTVPRRIGTVFVRDVNFLSENKIELKTEPEKTRSGAVYEAVLVWKRRA